MGRAREIVFVVRTNRFTESLTFYQHALELELIEEWRAGGHGAVLRLTSEADLELIELDAPGPHGGVALGLEVDDVDVWYERLIDGGVVPNAAPVDAFGKRGFGVADPNGVPVNIYTSESARD